MNYPELIDELLISLGNELIILREMWNDSDIESRKGDIINGQAMECAKIIELIEKKFKRGHVEFI